MLSLLFSTITAFFKHNHSKKSVYLFHFLPTTHATLITNSASAMSGPHSPKTS